LCLEVEMLNEIPFIPYNQILPHYAWIKKFENDVIQGMVRSSGTEKWVEWKGARIPLPKDSELPEGAWLQIRIVSTSRGYELDIELLKGSNVNTASPKVSDLLSKTQQNFLGKDHAIYELVQKVIGYNPDLVGKIDLMTKLFYKWFDDANTINQLFANINKIIQEAIEKGVLDSSWLKIYPGNIVFQPNEKIDWQVIGNFFKWQMQNLSFEKQLFLKEEGAESNIQKSLIEIKDYRVLQALLKNESFVGFLRSKGYYQEFQKNLDTLFSKFMTNQLLNLINTNYSYLVLDLPVSVHDGFNRVCIHTCFSRKEEQNKGKKHQYAVVAFDIELINAGKMWIELRWLEDTLDCLFRVVEKETERICKCSFNELEDSFKSLGLKNINIRIQSWDGDRIKSMVSLLESIENKGWSV